MAETDLSDRLVYRAWPTVRVNGQPHERLNELLLMMEMNEQEDGLSSLALRLTNVATETDGRSASAFEDEAVVKLGDRIAVYAGDEQAPQEIFEGLVTAFEANFPENAAPELVVLAEDDLQKARMKRRTKTHENVTLADISREVASSLGLTPRITGFTENIGVQVQMNESDLGFLRRLLARHDGDVQVVGRELQVSPRGDVRRGLVELTLHSQLLRARARVDLAHQVTEVTVSGWDAARGSRFSGRSTGANPGPGTGRRGADLLEQAAGPRPHAISHVGVTTEAEARALADAAFDERQRRFVCVHATAEGNPRLRVGAHASLSGLGPRFDNTYYVTRCRHHFDLDHGYRTDFDGECAFLGTP